jgi:hypothetical protein
LQADLTLLITAFARSGDHAGARRTVEQLAALGGSRLDDAYIAASALAQCIPVAEKETKLSEEGRAELAPAYADGALGMLRRAIRNGYHDVAYLKQDTDLDPLRSGNDFQKLIQDLEERHTGQSPAMKQSR